MAFTPRRLNFRPCRLKIWPRFKRSSFWMAKSSNFRTVSLVPCERYRQMHEFFGRSKIRPVPVEVAKVFLKRVLRTLANLLPFISPELWEVHPSYQRWVSWDHRFSSCYGLWLVNGCLRNLWPIKTQFRYLYDPRNPRAEISTQPPHTLRTSQPFRVFI